MSDTKPNEQWARIHEWEKYMVSNLGKIMFSDGKSVREKALITGSDGYTRVTFWDKPNKRVKTFSIHRLVATYFVGGNKSLDVAHIDGIKSNNKHDNLKWCSRKENEADKKTHKTFWAGQRSPILNKHCVLAIIGLRNLGWSQQKIAGLFQISQQTVHNAIKPNYADALIKELNKDPK